MFATIYLPNFYLQAAMRHHPKLRAQPVALIDTAESKVSIIQLNELAEKAGVAKRMTPSQALARCLQVARHQFSRGASGPTRVANRGAKRISGAAAD